MIDFDTFIESLLVTIERLFDFLDASARPSAILYVWGGEKMGKSNSWINLIFWDFYRARYDGRDVFDFRIVGKKENI